MSNACTKAAAILLPLLVAVVALAVWNPRGDYWHSVELPKAQVEAYSEASLASANFLDSSIYDPVKLMRVVREPQNTVSNFAYIVAGLSIVIAGRRALSLSYGSACIFLGVFSGLYHASLLPEWRMMDILGVYAVLFSVLALGTAAVLRRGPHLSIVALTWLSAFYTGIHRNDVRVGGLKLFDSKNVVVGCVVLASILALWAVRSIVDKRRYVRVVFVLALSAGLAFFGGYADRFGGLWALPNALIQGHAVWHTFGAVALLAAYEIFVMTGYDRSVFCELGAVMEPLKSATSDVVERVGTG